MQSLIPPKAIEMYDWNDGIRQYNVFFAHPCYMGQVVIDNEVVFEVYGKPHNDPQDVNDELEEWVKDNFLTLKVYIFDYHANQSYYYNIPSGVKVVIAHSEFEAIKLANIPDYFTVNITHVPLNNAYVAYEDFNDD